MINNNLNEKELLWAERIQSYRESGLSAKAWSNKACVNANTLKYWISRFNKESNKKQQNAENNVKWTKINPMPDDTVIEDSSLKISVGNAFIEINNDVNIQLLEIAVQVLSKYA